jgi:predicted phosphodiesterase
MVIIEDTTDRGGDLQQIASLDASDIVAGSSADGAQSGTGQSGSSAGSSSSTSTGSAQSSTTSASSSASSQSSSGQPSSSGNTSGTSQQPNGSDEPAADDPDEPEENPSTPPPVEPPDTPEPPKPEPIKPIRIVAVGDIACDPFGDDFRNGTGVGKKCHFKQLGDLIRKQKADAVLLLGDLQYQYGRYDRLQKSYGTYWKDILDISYTIPGNHDYINYARPDQKGIEDAYYRFFGENSSPKNKAMLAKTDSNGVKKGYYSLDLANSSVKWHLIGLNTNNLCIQVACSAASAQGQWLKQDLAASSATKCTIAMAHYPPSNSVPAGTTDNAIRSLQIGNAIFDNQLKGKVDIALFGHVHNYERLKKTGGTRAFLSGLGSKGFTRAGSTVVGDYFYTGKAGVLRLDLYKDSYTWALVTEDGKIKDSGKDTCS